MKLSPTRGFRHHIFIPLLLIKHPLRFCTTPLPVAHLKASAWPCYSKRTHGPQAHREARRCRPQSLTSVNPSSTRPGSTGSTQLLLSHHDTASEMDRDAAGPRRCSLAPDPLNEAPPEAEGENGRKGRKINMAACLARRGLGGQGVVVPFAALALTAEDKGRGQEEKGRGHQQEKAEASEDPHHLGERERGEKVRDCKQGRGTS